MTKLELMENHTIDQLADMVINAGKLVEAIAALSNSWADEIKSLKSQLGQKQTEINQIDEILNKLFGVTHDAVKTTDEFEKILRRNAEEHKNLSNFLPEEPIGVADIIIRNFKQGTYPVYERNADGEIKYVKINDKSYAVETGGYEKYEEVRQIAEHLLVYCNYVSEGRQWKK